MYAISHTWWMMSQLCAPAFRGVPAAPRRCKTQRKARKYGILRTIRPPGCGVPAADCRGGEGQAEMRPFTHGKTANLRRTRRESTGRGGGLFRPVVHNFKENRRWHTLFKNLVNFSHRKFCTFWTKISFFKNFEKILRFLKIKNWRSFWHFFQILKIPPFILIYKKGHKGAWHICSAAAAQRRRKCGRLRRPPAAATLRHPSLRSGPLWNHMWTLVSAYFLHLKFRSIGTEKIIRWLAIRNSSEKVNSTAL